MTAINMLRLPQFQLPMKYENESYGAFLSRVLDEYVDRVESISYLTKDPISLILSGNKRRVELLVKCIKKCLHEYSRGDASGAYVQIETAIDVIRPCLERLESHDGWDANKFCYYRTRESDFSCLEKKDIFHIPFNLRHLVSTQRYSMPGFPCLYLGGSSYVCSLELGVERRDRLCFSRFWLKGGERLKIIDFGYRPIQILHAYDNMKRSDALDLFFASYMICWPLIAASSVKVKSPDAAFKQEYVIPQLIVQWIIKHRSEIDGIRYFTTKTDAMFGDVHLACNYVFPAREIEEYGHCSALARKFALTPAIRWQEAREMVFPFGFSSSNHAPMSMFIQGNGIPCEYGRTAYGQLDSQLNQFAYEIKVGRVVGETGSL